MLRFFHVLTRFLLVLALAGESLSCGRDVRIDSRTQKTVVHLVRLTTAHVASLLRQPQYEPWRQPENVVVGDNSQSDVLCAMAEAPGVFAIADENRWRVLAACDRKVRRTQ